MNIRLSHTLLFALLILSAINVNAGVTSDEVPTISPTATYITDEGEEENSTMDGNAPLTGRFEANAANVGDYSATYQWRFTLDEEETPYLIRYEEDTEYTFTTAGTHKIELYATFINGTDTIEYTADYWSENDPLTVTISESALEMPNAFSPNGDGINDIYMAKDGYQSIIEFNAYIFNRWGQKLYEWHDVEGGWDGTYNGKDVKQGVYYVLVKAKGADGRTFTIKRDVNLLRGYSENE
ncbi:MAG: gliding motility-associated C-terminal domain-containing protein [Prevotellaceae bacterium]|nr:gliding motility-associated C-terminal domain-containing protein [Prevotellaceae bacterium]